MLCTHPKYFSQSNLKAIWHTKGKNIGQGPWCGSLSFCWLDKELDFEEQLAQESQDVGDDDDNNKPLDSWVDFRDGLTEEEVEDLDVSIQLVRLMLSKVCWSIFDSS